MLLTTLRYVTLDFKPAKQNSCQAREARLTDPPLAGEAGLAEPPLAIEAGLAEPPLGEAGLAEPPVMTVHGTPPYTRQPRTV
jgi:hypothetical protein